MKIKTYFVFSALIAAFSLEAGISHAQEYPVKPIRMIIPYSAGGTTDILGRIAAEKLGNALGQAIIVENKPGANSMIGTAQVANAPADGYTLLLTAPSVVMNEFLYEKPTYNALKDLRPISLVATTPYFMFIQKDVPATTLQEFVALAKKNPNKYAYGSSGKGGTPHVVGELFQMSSGTQLLHVPYKGTGPAVIDLAAGQIQAMFVGLPATGAFMSKGTLRLLATAEATRSPLMPDVPTMKELGYPGVETSNWFGLFGPANTPTAVVDKIAAELSKISKSEDIRKAFAELGAVSAISTAPEFDAYFRSDRERWMKVIQANPKVFN